jgi:hypothetical protein
MSFYVAVRGNQYPFDRVTTPITFLCYYSFMKSTRPETCKGCYHLPDAPMVVCTRCQKSWYADHTASIAVRTYLYHVTTILCIKCAPSVMAAFQEHGLIPNVGTVLAEIMEKARTHVEHMPVIE